ncbi:MAG: response regulator transcription factor [Acidobacteriota bacterium]
MQQPVVLVVEDSAAIRKGVGDALRAAGYNVRECARGDEAAHRALETPLDLVLLDVMLPGLDGFTLLENLRRARPRVGIIMLTARGTEDDRVRGLRLGADDYVVKPFSARELLARVEAVSRRLAERPLDIARLRSGDRTIDLARREVTLNGEASRSLSEREAEILRFLALHRGRAVGREELLTQVWGYRTHETRTVDMHIVRLREKVEPRPPTPEIIVTVRAKGYMLGRGVEILESSHPRGDAT